MSDGTTHSFPAQLLTLLVLPLLALFAAALILAWDADSEPPARVQVAASYPSPPPVTFIPPTPEPTAPRPTLAPPPDSIMGAQVPDYTLTTLDGATIRLRDLQGEIVLLNFWATWCAPCQAEMPLLQQVQDEGRANGVRVIAVTDPTDGQTEDSIRVFLDERDLTLTVALTTDRAFFDTFQAVQIPVTYFIDRTGAVRFWHLGELHDHDVAAYLAAIDG